MGDIGPVRERYDVLPVEVEEPAEPAPIDAEELQPEPEGA